MKSPFTIRVEAEDIEAWKRAANLKGQSISEWARRALNHRAAEEDTRPYPAVPAKSTPYLADDPLPTFIPDVENEDATGEPENLRGDPVVRVAPGRTAVAHRPVELARSVAEQGVVTPATSNEPEEGTVGTGGAPIFPPLSAPQSNLREMPPQPKPPRSYQKKAKPEKVKPSKAAGKWRDMDVCRHGIAVGACAACKSLGG